MFGLQELEDDAWLRLSLLELVVVVNVSVELEGFVLSRELDGVLRPFEEWVMSER